MKTCQACERRPAVVEFIQVTGDERREMALCRECALSIGVRAQVEAFQRLSQLLTQQETPGNLFDAEALQTKCSNCGLKFEEFVRTGLLGCPRCYQDFHELLKPALRRLHGVIKQMPEDSIHPSQMPPASREGSSKPEPESRTQLEAELNLALLDEDYERAAALRDKLRQL
jgi:protein arginine kinase activator